MKHKYRFFLIVAGLLFFGGLQSCNKKSQEQCGQECLENILQKHWQQYAQKYNQKNIGVALYIQSADKTIFASYGFTQPYDKHFLFRGASTTKSFTSAAILKLYQEGKLHIDDKITDNIPGTQTPYLPNTPEYAIPHKSDITIRMLLNHRAGVFDVTNNVIPENVSAPYAGRNYVDYITELYGGHHDFTKLELLKPVVDHQLEFFPPDSAFHYSNTGYSLLGMIVENVSGMSLDQYQQEYLINPLQLNNTYMAVTEAQSKVPDPTTDYYAWVDGTIIANFYDNLSSAQAEGNIITTIEDLGTWAYRLWGTNEVLNAATLHEMTTMIPTNEIHEFYGLGCEGGPPEIGYGHNGARAGTMITMRYDPVSKASYTLYTNFLDAEDLPTEGAVTNDIIKAAQQQFQ